MGVEIEEYLGTYINISAAFLHLIKNERPLEQLSLFVIWQLYQTANPRLVDEKNKRRLLQ